MHIGVACVRELPVNTTGLRYTIVVNFHRWGVNGVTACGKCARLKKFGMNNKVKG
jgi:hypothetical protein